MFKALDTTTGRPVISLDDRGRGWPAELRRKGRDDLLHCPTCRQAVILRAGPEKRLHFAHRSLGNCPTQAEPPELLEARAVLYEWLRSKFADAATLERPADGGQTPRPLRTRIVVRRPSPPWLTTCPSMSGARPPAVRGMSSPIPQPPQTSSRTVARPCLPAPAVKQNPVPVPLPDGILARPNARHQLRGEAPSAACCCGVALSSAPPLG